MENESANGFEMNSATESETLDPAIYGSESCIDTVAMPFLPARSHPVAHRVLLRPIGALDMDMEHWGRRMANLNLIVPDYIRQANISAADKGIVLQIGPDAWKDSPSGVQAKIGDVVAFVRHAGCVMEEINPETGAKQVLRVVNDIDIFYNHGPFKPEMDKETQENG